MKCKFFYFVLAVLTAGVASTALASPFAVTGKFTTGVVSSCVFVLNSGTSVTNAPVSADATTSVCKYDVGTVAEGNNVVSVQYKNVWGSSTAVPFSFVKTLPPTPSGTHLEE